MAVNIMVRKLFIFILVVTLSFSAQAKRLNKESWYQQKHCKGIVEYVLADKTRVDCIVNARAIEYDFASKWAEAIGQSLHYSRMTGLAPGIVLICEKPSDIKYFIRAKKVIKYYNLPIKIIAIDENLQQIDD